MNRRLMYMSVSGLKYRSQYTVSQVVSEYDYIRIRMSKSTFRRAYCVTGERNPYEANILYILNLRAPIGCFRYSRFLPPAPRMRT